MILVNGAASSTLNKAAWFTRIRTMNRKIYSTVSSSKPVSLKIQHPCSESNPGIGSVALSLQIPLKFCIFLISRRLLLRNWFWYQNQQPMELLGRKLEYTSGRKG